MKTNNCDTCEYKQLTQGGWCYMFREEPQEHCHKHTMLRGSYIKCPKPTLSCPNMKSRENDTSMSYEHYDCKVCGGHIALDYDEMR